MLLMISFRYTGVACFAFATAFVFYAIFRKYDADEVRLHSLRSLCGSVADSCLLNRRKCTTLTATCRRSTTPATLLRRRSRSKSNTSCIVLHCSHFLANRKVDPKGKAGPGLVVTRKAWNSLLGLCSDDSCGCTGYCVLVKDSQMSNLHLMSVRASFVKLSHQQRCST